MLMTRLTPIKLAPHVMQTLLRPIKEGPVAPLRFLICCSCKEEVAKAYLSYVKRLMMQQMQ